MSKHTPGPWEVVHDARKGYLDSVRVKRFGNTDMMGDYQGCIVCDLTAAHGGREHAMAESEANATLIAAAPDYDKAVRDFILELSECLTDEAQVDVVNHYIDEVFPEIMEKAEGRHS